MTGRGKKSPPNPHHLVGRGVFIGFIQVTLAIVWLSQAAQFSIQRDVGHVICCEHQQVQSIFAPTDLFLKDGRQRVL